MSTTLQKSLLAGELDLMVGIEGGNGGEITSEPLAVYPVRWIARAGLLALHKEGLAQRLLHFPILTFGRGTAPHRMLEDIVAPKCPARVRSVGPPAPVLGVTGYRRSAYSAGIILGEAIDQGSAGAGQSQVGKRGIEIECPRREHRQVKTIG